MGTKTRIRNTSILRGPVSREVLDRYEIQNNISYAELRFEQARVAAERSAERQQKRKGRVERLAA